MSSNWSLTNHSDSSVGRRWSRWSWRRFPPCYFSNIRSSSELLSGCPETHPLPATSFLSLLIKSSEWKLHSPMFHLLLQEPAQRPTSSRPPSLSSCFYLSPPSPLLSPSSNLSALISLSLTPHRFITGVAHMGFFLLLLLGRIQLILRPSAPRERWRTEHRKLNGSGDQSGIKARRQTVKRDTGVLHCNLSLCNDNPFWHWMG